MSIACSSKRLSYPFHIFGTVYYHWVQTWNCYLQSSKNIEIVFFATFLRQFLAEIALVFFALFLAFLIGYLK